MRHEFQVLLNTHLLTHLPIRNILAKIPNHSAVWIVEIATARTLIVRKSALEKTQLSDVLITDNLF